MAGNNFSTRNMGHDVSDQPRLSNGQFTFKGGANPATAPYHSQQAGINAPIPVSTDAPLEERMYPDTIADVVKRHAYGGHSDLQPYTQDSDAAVPYYRMGVWANLNLLKTANGMEKESQGQICTLNTCILLAVMEAISA